MVFTQSALMTLTSSRDLSSVDFIQMRIPLWTFTYHYPIQPLFRPFVCIWSALITLKGRRGIWTSWIRMVSLSLSPAVEMLLAACPQRWFFSARHLSSLVSEAREEISVVAVFFFLVIMKSSFLIPCLLSFYWCLNFFVANSGLQVSQVYSSLICHENILNDKEH